MLRLLGDYQNTILYSRAHANSDSVKVEVVKQSQQSWIRRRVTALILEILQAYYTT